MATAFVRQFLLELHKTVNGKHQKVGQSLIPCPTLADFGISAETEKDEKGQPKQDVELDPKGNPLYENGLPVYIDPKAQWLQDAIKLAVTTKVRNKFDNGRLKPNMELPTDFDSLTAASARTGEALAIRREARLSFENYLRAQNRKDAVVQKLGELFWNSSKVLGTVSDRYLEAISTYAEQWVAQLDEASKARFLPKISELNESIAAAQGEDDLLSDDSEEKEAA